MTILTIVIPTYNRPEKLLSAISALVVEGQITGGVEVIVVSDDPSEDVSGVIEAKHGKIESLSVINNETNMGAPASRNKGFNSASGDWILFLDDDDQIDHESIEIVLYYLMKEKIGNIGIMRSKILPDNGDPFFVSPTIENFGWRIRRFGQESNTSSMVFRRSLIEAISGWDEKLAAGQDTDLILRAASYSKPFLIKEAVVIIDQKGSDRITSNPRKQMVGKMQFLRKNYRRLHPIRTLRYFVTLVIAYPYLRRFLRWPL